jgi:pimeloyl-ACP methyl ester carboxylesterase
MGSQVALEFVQRHSGAAPSTQRRFRVRRLLLHTPPYSFSAMTAFMRRQVRLASFQPLFWTLKAMQRNDVIFNRYKRLFIEGPGLIEEDNLMNALNQRRADARTALQIGQDCLVHDYTELLRSLDVPTLVIVPEKDVLVVVPEVKALERLMPHCRVEVIEGAGHGWTPAFVERQNAILSEFAELTDPG